MFWCVVGVTSTLRHIKIICVENTFGILLHHGYEWKIVEPMVESLSTIRKYFQELQIDLAHPNSNRLKNISTYRAQEIIFYDKNKLAKIFCKK